MGTNKNQHNKDTGSNIERSDERIAETQPFMMTERKPCEQIMLFNEKQN